MTTSQNLSALPAEALPTPSSAINASSGASTAAAGQAQTSTDSTQLLAGVVADGTGSLTVANEHSSSVTDTSSASAQSGLSVALAPTVMPGTPVPSGVTTANSGATSATGLRAQNAVSNTSAGIVQVSGANQAPVSAVSSSSIDIKNTAASGAASGAAWAVANGAAGSPSGVVTPDVAGASQPVSAPAASTGTTAQNNVSNTFAATMTVPGGARNARSVAVSGNQTVNVSSGGSAAAVSAPAAATGAGANGNAQAASGSTSAVGLTAQNAVSSNANVSVHVAGLNFAPIQIIIASVTRIFNLGIASSTSGDVTAGSAAGGSAGTTASNQPVASGSAQATGAQAMSAVDLHSSAAVNVQGDNYNPISIVLNQAANLVNWGVGLARTGDASAAGAGGGTASSGAASATGLQVMNLVSMQADASVNITGNNYAPIFIKISFTTNIDNRGYAGASSGNVAAGYVGSPSATPATASTSPVAANSTGSGGSQSGGIVGSSSKAIGGDATAIGNQVTANVVSTQLSSANGSHPIGSTTIVHMLRSLPAGNWNPFLEQNLPASSTPAVQSGLASQSGNALASGLQSQVDQINTQLAACRDSKVACVAANFANLSIVARDGKTNPATRTADGGPGVGGVNARSADALANVTPTPTPSPKADASRGTTTSGASNGESQGTQHRRGTSTRAVFATEDLLADGHVVLVDLWDQWPGRRLPPMPNPLDQQPTTTSVTASLDGWPGVDELPLPDLDQAPDATEPPADVQARGGLNRQPSHDGAASESEEIPVMQLVDVDPWPIANAVEALPMPLQALPAVAIAPPSVDVAVEPTIPVEPDDPGVAPVEFGLAALLSALGGLIGLRRGRLLFKLRHLFEAIRVGRRTWFAAMLRPGQRVLAVVRLAVGILRLW